MFNIPQGFGSGINRKYLSLGLQITVQKKLHFTVVIVNTHTILHKQTNGRYECNRTSTVHVA